uniref:Uncharacterized protein n=1 Tax=Oryza sativa subsp. japonica TaxID=39947 RepID=Q8H497_ORYSJ|nr:hypothetical protein [Oryza sativa Japonica Group]
MSALHPLVIDGIRVDSVQAFQQTTAVQPRRVDLRRAQHMARKRSPKEMEEETAEEGGEERATFHSRAPAMDGSGLALAGRRQGASCSSPCPSYPLAKAAADRGPPHAPAW